MWFQLEDGRCSHLRPSLVTCLVADAGCHPEHLHSALHVTWVSSQPGGWVPRDPGRICITFYIEPHKSHSITSAIVISPAKSKEREHRPHFFFYVSSLLKVITDIPSPPLLAPSSCSKTLFLDGLNIKVTCRKDLWGRRHLQPFGQNITCQRLTSYPMRPPSSCPFWITEPHYILFNGSTTL